MTLHSVGHMVEMGLMTSVVAPGIVLATRRRWSWAALTLPAAVVLPVFVVIHGVITVEMSTHEPGFWMHLLLHGILIAGAIVFWLPVLGPRSRLTAAGRCGYLFLAAPALDLAGVIVVARGDSVGGLAMIVAMLPIGLTAVILSWRWLQAEDRAVRAKETAVR